MTKDFLNMSQIALTHKAICLIILNRDKGDREMTNLEGQTFAKSQTNI